MRILGLDPGSRVTGIGVVEARADDVRYIHHECLRLGGGDIGGRLAAIFAGVTDVCRRFEVEVAAVERVFVASNARSALILGHARGSALCALVTAGVTIHEYSAREVKSAVVGTGAAEKQQVQHMVRVLLGLSASPPADAADALACAICHAHTARHAARTRAAIDRGGARVPARRPQ
jgi:crossover junction endodeoxyribonuclease RuvC